MCLDGSLEPVPDGLHLPSVRGAADPRMGVRAYGCGGRIRDVGEYLCRDEEVARVLERFWGGKIKLQGDDPDRAAYRRTFFFLSGIEKLLIKFFMTGLGLCLFGLANLLYLPISFGLGLFGKPFPFEHIYNVFKHEKGTRYQVDYLPIDAAANDPYWLIWSLALYVGIAMMIATSIPKLKTK